MNRIPVFRNDIRIKIVPPDLCFFFYETGYEVLESHLICLIAPLINGKNSVSTIARKLKAELTSFDLECLLLLLEDEGFFEESMDESVQGFDLFSEVLGITAKIFENEIKRSRINLVTFGHVSPEPFRSTIQNLGIKITEKAEFTVVLTDSYLRHELMAFNEKAIRKKMRWMLIKPTGTVFWSGPAFAYQHPPCWECTARRLTENLRAQTFPNGLERNLKQKLLQVSAAFDLAAIHILKNLKSQDSETSTIQTLDLKTMKLETHLITRSDQCSFCSKKKSLRSPKITLKSQRPGTNHRSASAEQTFEKYKHLISPLTGIVHEITFAESNTAFYSATAKHAFVIPPEKEYPLVLRLKRTSMGKGLTPQSSATGALCEALERHSGIFRGNENRIKASFNELNGAAIHPYTFLNFSDSQYKNREELNQSNSQNDWIPAPFNETRKIEWTPVWSLTQNTMKYVPTAYCYYGYFLPPKQRFCRADSNGNASGNTLEEAILYAILELVERDAVALWWYNRIQRSSIDLESFRLPFVSALQEEYRKLGRSIRVFDVTSDFDIPVFAAVSSMNVHSQFIFGFAADYDPQAAVTRALMEMNQFIDTPGRNFEETLNTLKFLLPEPKVSEKHFEDFPGRRRIDYSKEIMRFVKLAEKWNMETLILNQTRPDIALPVVKVIVPGMRQFWARFAKGRLFDIPAQLGWLKTPLRQHELNPHRIMN